MREPRPIEGAKAPLFERFAAAPRGAGSQRVLDTASLRESVRLSLGQLLNTRSSGSLVGDEAVEGTVLDYGIPDLASLAPASGANRKLLEETLARRIAAHEPRLGNIQVSLNPSPGNPTALVGSITASLRLGSVYEQVSFALALDREGARADAVEVST